MYRWNQDFTILQGFGLASMQAMSAVLTLLVVQIIDVILLVEKITGISIFLYFGDSSILVLTTIGAVFCLIVYAIFGGEAGFKKIIDEFDKKAEPKKLSIIRGFLVWIYAGFWIGWLLIVVWSD